MPGALTRYGLSEVVNHLLALDPPKPFDFLVDGELVRTSLRKLLLRKAISAEKTLDVEYIPAVGPPAETSVGKHEDWISAVDGGFAGAIATGCYDGTVGLWSPSGTRLLTVAVPNAANNAITSVALLPTFRVERRWNEPSTGARRRRARRRRAIVGRDFFGEESLRERFPGLRGPHRRDRGDRRRARRRPLRDRVQRRDRARLAPRRRRRARLRRRSRRASAKGRRRLRQAAKGVRERRRRGTRARRRAREVVLDFGDDADDDDGPLAPLGAELVLGDHRGGVTCVGWESPEAVWSGGDDKTMKRWDADSGACTQSFDAPKAVASLAVRADGARVLWCGGGDRGVHAWDPRAGQTTGGITTFASHQVRFAVSVTLRPERARFFLFS